MDKKELQKQRMMKYFIDAAKTLMKQEDIKELSVRKIADLAGYSYATLYNYFRDLEHLLWHVIVDILDELAEKLQMVVQSEEHTGIDKIKESGRIYVNYFLENPNAFRLAFTSNPGVPPEDIVPKLKQPTIGGILSKMVWECTEDAAKGAIISEVLVGMIHGQLLFHISLNQIDKEHLLQSMDNACELLFKK